MGPTDLDHTGFVQHGIFTTPCPPVKQQTRRMARDKQTAADQQVQQSLDTGVARPSNSGWAAPIIMVKKKDQTLWLCADYRPLNERTIKDAYPLPQIQDTLDTLRTARNFSMRITDASSKTSPPSPRPSTNSPKFLHILTGWTSARRRLKS